MDAKKVHSSVIDGIAINSRFRERQLASLHGVLSASRADIINAAKNDSISTSTETTAEFLLTLNALKLFHTTVNPHICLKEEYKISDGKNDLERRDPYGYSFIIPSSHSQIYSTVVPVGAAIAAGNCVLIQINHESTSISQLLQKLLTKALDPETFIYVKDDPFDPEFQESFRILMDGTPTDGATSTSTSIATPATRVMAIVDRSADIRSAARDCVHARFGFGGSSPYAPDLVLVNEYYTRDFCAAILESSLHFIEGSGNVLLKGKSKELSKSHSEAEVLKDIEISGTILASGSGGKVVLVDKDHCVNMCQKIGAPTLLIASISSLDDAIDWLNASNRRLLASYIYASPPAAKYLSQFTKSSIVCINHVPRELLIGPPAPVGFPATIHPRYLPTMFSNSNPAIITASAISEKIATAFGPTCNVKDVRHMEDEFDVTLSVVKEPFGPKIGFFEQGFLIGAGVLVSTVVVSSILSLKYGWKLYAVILGR